jgi:perosamine synthetase
MDFFNTVITDSAKRRLLNILDTTFISAGKNAAEFEKELENNLGLVNVVTVNSGTSALHLGLEIAGVGNGDEVILPAQTFVASGLAILMTGAIPVFADIQFETGNIDPNSVRQKVTKKTKAIMPVHWAGYPCDMDEINQIAKENDLIVIEDAAHALGATYKNKPIGSISQLTAFSFQAIKHLTTGDGGALCCIEEKLYKKAQNRRWFGIDRENSTPSVLGERVFNIREIGYKYHMNDLAATLGLGNLEGFSKKLERIRDIASKYRAELGSISGLQLLDYKNDRESAYWLFTILVENRDGFIKKMKEKDIPVSVVHQRIDRYSVFGQLTPELLNQEKFDDNQIAIPIHSGLTNGDIHKIITLIKSGW